MDFDDIDAIEAIDDPDNNEDLNEDYEVRRGSCGFPF